MKYYLIAGEASGDLHASRLMKSLKDEDSEAEFRFFGGDMMSSVGGHCVKHYRELAYMGFIPVLLHLNTILENMSLCRKDIIQWQPDALILIDYPGFNLKIAKYIKAHTGIPIYYYISPKIWAWKEYRIKNIRRDVDELFSILPFEVEFFEQKHHYPIHYVGNPTADEVEEFKDTYLKRSNADNITGKNSTHELSDKPVIAILAGSRKQEIKDNLPHMIKATEKFTEGYQPIVAGAPGIPEDYYNGFIKGTGVRIIHGRTYELLCQATAALVTSGTATLETALFGVPQVVCYKTPVPKLIAFLRRHLLKVKYISLVNLIADREVVPELVADTFTTDNIRKHLEQILPEGKMHRPMLDGYKEVDTRLGKKNAPQNAAKIMIKLLRQR
ncbi:lipid-A-disaccharide synthase [Xylanibacter muris]|uniref:Lipid-A-disaccharide synthase n=1 Tax=Xylanibacter muris TaxID=2736290 RepID=A0ABX2AK61_9BACT|nr:lipid-A-disaccharide synthase [Xylanibacter muris]NPD91578.1 lipid-A-disaccharide synthase [Xylanibacter muris]